MSGVTNKILILIYYYLTNISSYGINVGTKYFVFDYYEIQSDILKLYWKSYVIFSGRNAIMTFETKVMNTN